MAALSLPTALFVLRASFAIVLMVAALAAGYAVARRLAPDASASARGVATAVCALYWLTCGSHALLAVRRFDLGGATAFVFASLALAVSALPPTALRGAVMHDARMLACVSRRRVDWLAAAFLASLAVTALRFLVTPSFAWDSLTYHLTKPALWIQEAGRPTFEAPGTWSMYEHTYAGGEVLWSWAMLPFRSDLVVGLCDVAVWAFAALGTYVLGREMGLGARQGALAALFWAAVPAAFRAAGSAYVDNLACGLLVAGLAFVTMGLRRRPGAFVLAGMALGLAAGTKLTAVPSLGLVALCLLAWMTRARPRGVFPIWLAAAAVISLLVFLPWPVHSLAETGNPIGGKPLSLFGFDLPGKPVYETYLDIRTFGEPYRWSTEWTAVRTLIHAPLGPSLGLFSVVPLALLPVGLWRWGQKSRWAALAAAGAVSSFLCLYWSAAYSVVRLGWAAVNARLFLVAVAVAAPAGFLALPRRARGAYGGLLAAAAALGFWHQAFLGWTATEWNTTLGLGFLAGGLVILVRRCHRSGVAAALLATFVASCIFLGAAQLLRDRHRYEIAQGTTVLHEVSRYWLPLARLLDRPPHGFRIAVTAGFRDQADHWFLYPLLGSRLQNRIVYVPPTLSGRVLPLNDPRLDAEADQGAWVARLAAADVDVVVSFVPRSRELGWMREAPHAFKPLLGGEDWGVFERTRTPQEPQG